VREIDGIEFTFTIDQTPRGEKLRFTTDEPFTGTILVKGGPFHFTCTFRDPVTSGTCHAPVNPNNDNNDFYDISHVDVCVEEFPTPPGGPGPDREVEQEFGGGGPGPTAVATAAPAESLPFTGLDAHWLLLVGGSLLGCGALVRKRIA
jgi:hypothetical protein